VSPKSNDRSLDKKRRDTQRRSHVRTEAEMGGMWPQAQGCPELREAGRDSLEPPEGAQPCPTWISEFWSLRLGGNRLLLF